jgi:polyisoprenoid-binding protein YceI
MPEQTRRVPLFWKIAIPVVVVLGGLAFAGWWFILRDDAPPEARLPDRPAATTVAGASDGPTTAPGSTAATSRAASADGTWTVQQGDQVFVGYRVTEQFAGETIEKTAVGRTPAVTGTVTVQGSTVPSAEFEADMTKLASDSGRRDNQLRGNGLKTNQFPTASFELTKPIALTAPPAVGAEMDVQATGNLTLHGVTKEVTIPLKVRWSGDLIDIAGQAPIVMADYGINPPSIGGFVSVAGEGVFELQLTLVKA